MSGSLYDRKKQFEEKALEAYKNKDYAAAYDATLKAAKLTMELRDQCTGAMYDAYEKDAMSLVTLAESLQQKTKSLKNSVTGNDDGSEETPKGSLAERPDVRLDDVAGMEDVKDQIRLRMIEPLKRPDEAKKHGLKLGGGILLYGPPGTGKTFIAKAVAGELNLPFYTITPADVFGMYVGESPKNIKAIFEKARENPLSVLFIDELESIVKKKDGNIHETTHQVINVLLQELDGINSANKNPILLIGATNTPWNIEEAFLRSGRFDVKAYVGMPDKEARRKIIQNSLKKVEYPVDQDAIDYIVEETEDFSGADLTGIIELARQMAFDNHLTRYTKDLLEKARKKALPSCCAETAKKIEEWEESMGIVRDKKKK